jgi:hypothetical protein
MSCGNTLARRQLTRGDVLWLHIRYILRKYNGESTKTERWSEILATQLEKSNWRIQVPVNVAMEEPRSRVVREEPDRYFVPSVTNTHNISDDRVVEIVRRIPCAPDYMEIMPM